MSRLTALGSGLAAFLVLAAPAASAIEVQVSVSPNRPAALERTVVVVRAFAPLIREDGSCCRLEPYAPQSYPFRVEAVSPTGKTSRIALRHARANEWRGVVRFSVPGRWEIRLPQFLKTIRVRVGPPVPTPAPSGFGALGRPGCSPPSPADASTRGLRNVFGTAVGDEQVWALPFLPSGATWARADAAAFDGLVGKEMKIVFASTTVRSPFHAVAPTGRVVEPVWRRGHLGPTWVGIPGHQWGAGFVFSEPGCWRIRVGPRADLWLLVRS